MSKPDHYSIHVELNPRNHTLKAEAQLTFRPQANTQSLAFLLHRDLAMHDVSAPNLTAWISSGPSSFPFTPEAVAWQLHFAQPLLAEQTYEIFFRYEGKLREVCWGINRLTTAWTELGLYAPWFPWQPSHDPFTYTVDIAMPPAYQVVGTGSVEQKDTGRWSLTADTPAMDIVIAAAPDLQQRGGHNGQAGLTLHYTAQENDVALGAILENGLWMLDFYQNWLQGEAKRHIDLVVAPREEGGGYAREGFVMLSTLAGQQPQMEPRLFKYIAHEIAHLWWVGAPVDSWEDWLNEAFAEFSALKATGCHLGTTVLQEYQADMRHRLPGLPPIRGIQRQDEKAHTVLYTKGALTLFALEELIGEQKMTALLRERLRRQVMNTDAFLSLLEEIAGRDAANQLNTWLETSPVQ